MSRMVSPYRYPERAAGHRNAEAIMPVNGICKRFHKTLLDGLSGSIS